MKILYFNEFLGIWRILETQHYSKFGGKFQTGFLLINRITSLYAHPLLLSCVHMKKFYGLIFFTIFNLKIVYSMLLYFLTLN